MTHQVLEHSADVATMLDRAFPETASRQGDEAGRLELLQRLHGCYPHTTTATATTSPPFPSIKS